MPPPPPTLSLHAFLALASLRSSYRSLLRSTRALATRSQRLEAVAFYRPAFVLQPLPASAAAAAAARDSKAERDRLRDHLSAVGRATRSLPWGTLDRGSAGGIGQWETFGAGEAREGWPAAVVAARRGRIRATAGAGAGALETGGVGT